MFSTIYNSQDMETIQVPINKLIYEDEDINIFMKIYTYNGTLIIKLMFIMPSSRGSSQPRDWTQVSHIAERLSEPPGKPNYKKEYNNAICNNMGGPR